MIGVATLIGALSASAGQPTIATGCDACRLVAQADANPTTERRADLQRQIDDLNLQARAINVQTPGFSVVLSWVGGLLAPTLIPWVLIQYVLHVPTTVLSTVAPTLLILGLVGVGCLATGLVFGLVWTSVMRHRRDLIVEQRQALEAELKQLPAAHRETGAPCAWVAAWHF
jgi:hypothetical protein